MSHSIQSFIKHRWISLSGTSRMIKSWPDICLQHFLDIPLQKTWNWSLKRLPKIYTPRRWYSFQWMCLMSTGKCRAELLKNEVNWTLPWTDGSCSLHVVHGAFRSGESKTKLGIDTLFKTLHNLFDEPPAKRDYTKITGSDILPLQLYCHRWLEDRSVAERALQIWLQITAYISETVSPVIYFFICHMEPP